MLSWAGLIAATALRRRTALWADHRSRGCGRLGYAAGFQQLFAVQLFIGDVPGMLGETCKLTLILGVREPDRAQGH